MGLRGPGVFQQGNQSEWGQNSSSVYPSSSSSTRHQGAQRLELKTQNTHPGPINPPTDYAWVNVNCIVYMLSCLYVNISGVNRYVTFECVCVCTGPTSFRFTIHLHLTVKIINYQQLVACCFMCFMCFIIVPPPLYNHHPTPSPKIPPAFSFQSGPIKNTNCNYQFLFQDQFSTCIMN